MRINNKNFEIYNMKINSFSIQTSDVNVSYLQPESGLYPVIGNVRMKPKPMKLIAEFNSKLDISNFMAEILSHKENLVDIDDGYLYHCYFTGSWDNQEYWQGMYRLTINLLVIQTGFMNKHKLSKTSAVNISGNWETECIYEIKSLSDMCDCNVNGIVIDQLRKGEKLVIDGLEKRAYTANQPNAYGKLKLLNNRFPVLRPGVQTITVPKNLELTIKYYPVFT